MSIPFLLRRTKKRVVRTSGKLSVETPGMLLLSKLCVHVAWKLWDFYGVRWVCMKMVQKSLLGWSPSHPHRIYGGVVCAKLRENQKEWHEGVNCKIKHICHAKSLWDKPNIVLIKVSRNFQVDNFSWVPRDFEGGGWTDASLHVNIGVSNYFWSILIRDRHKFSFQQI